MLISRLNSGLYLSGNCFSSLIDFPFVILVIGHPLYWRNFFFCRFTEHVELVTSEIEYKKKCNLNSVNQVQKIKSDLHYLYRRTLVVLKKILVSWSVYFPYQNTYCLSEYGSSCRNYYYYYFWMIFDYPKKGGVNKQMELLIGPFSCFVVCVLRSVLPVEGRARERAILPFRRCNSIALPFVYASFRISQRPIALNPSLPTRILPLISSW